MDLFLQPRTKKQRLGPDIAELQEHANTLQLPYRPGNASPQAVHNLEDDEQNEDVLSPTQRTRHQDLNQLACINSILRK